MLRINPSHHDTSPTRRPLIRLDPGWLFLIAGLAVVAATVLIPSGHDLKLARWERDRALAVERHRLERLERYGAYLDAVRRDDENVLLSLAATQLNVSPANHVPVGPLADVSMTSASPFPGLEPEPLNLPPRPEAGAGSSYLERLTIGDTSRLWLLAIGVVCILFGLLPPSTADDQAAYEDEAEFEDAPGQPEAA